MDSRKTGQSSMNKRTSSDMEDGRPRKRLLSSILVQIEDEEPVVKVFEFRVLLPNRDSVDMVLSVKGSQIPLEVFVNRVRQRYLSRPEKKHGNINWKSQDLHLVDAYEKKITKRLNLEEFKPNHCHILRLNDGSGDKMGMYDDMWDLTPATDVLRELPREYSPETALGDLIDNSLQAVWSNKPNERRLISVKITEKKIEIFDTGPGMDGSTENPLDQWGKMGASTHRSVKRKAIGGKPPYLTPFFGMFGSGAFKASMHIGRRALVSSKTKQSKKVLMLDFDREALLKTPSKQTWKTKGGFRDPSESEIEEAPHGSFTKVEIFEPIQRWMDIRRLQFAIKDIYFPYIQSDEVSRTGRTFMPIEFQVNGTNLAEIGSGEVAVTNLLSCNGSDFTVQLHFSRHGLEASSEANARLKCVYFPIIQGKEVIDRILETLEEDGCGISEDFWSFSRVSIRRLGRLLPDARWAWLPFMEPKQRKGNRGQILKRCCFRVKCFIDTDAGFNPTPSKTNLAHHDPYTIALRSLGSKTLDKEKDVQVSIIKDRKELSLIQLEKQFLDWISQMHDDYDLEAESGEDKPIVIVGPSYKKELGISSEVIRVHELFQRKGHSWRSGQKVKVLKGACSGFHKANIYATLEYIILENLEGDGGEARLICRPIDVPDESGCSLVENDGNKSIEIRRSISLPVSVIDSGKFVAVKDAEWECQVDKYRHKAASSIDLLRSVDCQDLRIEGEKSSCRNVEKTTQVKALPEVRRWGLLGDKKHPKLTARVGSSFPPISIACYDQCSNRIPFPCDTEAMIKISGGKEFTAQLTNMKQSMSTDNCSMTMVVQVESCALDKIRPSYEAKLLIFQQDKSFSVEIPCEGAPVFVFVQPPMIGKQLLPGQILTDLVLEIFDSYNNHVKEHEPITLEVDGFHVLRRDSVFEVDRSGCLNLSGLLKVKEGYGKTVSFSLLSNGRVIFKEAFQTESRVLRAAFDLPIFRAAGTQLENLIFEVKNTEGDVDKNVHNDDKTGQSHTLTLRSDSLAIDDSLRYSFSYGCCTVRTIPLPITEGIFYFEATHSHHPELHLSIEVHVKQALIDEHKNPQSQSPQKEALSFLGSSDIESLKLEFVDTHNQASDERLPLPLPDMPESSDLGNWVESLIDDDMVLQEDLRRCGLDVKKVEDKLEFLNSQRSTIDKEIFKLQDIDYSHDRECTSDKELVMEQIAGKSGSAAAVVFQEIGNKHSEQGNKFADNVLGVVACLGIVESNDLSRVLAKYLGEDQMLTIVCKSQACVDNLFEPPSLHARAAELGRPIHRQYLVICLENIRAYAGKICSDSQRKLDLPHPFLPDGRLPPGYLGYAVNMIDADAGHSSLKTAAGHGLRETLFYSLFGQLQVYENIEDMSNASSCITEGAVSLDGGIIMKNGAFAVGDWDPDIRFPVICSWSQVEKMKQIEDNKEKLQEITVLLKRRLKEHKKIKKKCQKKVDKYQKFLNEKGALLRYCYKYRQLALVTPKSE